MEKTKERNANGQGCFVMQEDGTYLYRKSAGYTPEGKRKILVVRGNTKSICIKLMKQKEAEWEREKTRLQVGQKDTVSNLCKKHLEYQIKNQELKPKSIDRRECTIVNQIEKYSLGHMQIQAVRPSDIDNLTSELINSGLSTSSVKKATDVIGAAYDWAISRGELNYNPVLQVRKSIRKRLQKLQNKTEAEADVIVLSDEEVKRFEDECLRLNANGTYKYSGGLYGRLLIHTGMRVGEMISLRWKDYDEEEGLLTINKSTSVVRNRSGSDDSNKYVSVVGTTKNQKSRIIKLTPEAVDDLDRIKGLKKNNPNDLICRTRTGGAYTATMLEHCMDTVYKALGFEEDVSGLHILRRTFATTMYVNGANAKEIAAYIGDLESTTLRYYIAAREKMRVGTATKLIVPVPGGKKRIENAPAGTRALGE